MSLRPTSWSVVYRHQPVLPAVLKCQRELVQIGVLAGGLVTAVITTFAWPEQFHGQPLGWRAGTEKYHHSHIKQPWANNCPYLDFECQKQAGQKNGEAYPRWWWPNAWKKSGASAEGHGHH